MCIKINIKNVKNVKAWQTKARTQLLPRKSRLYLFTVSNRSVSGVRLFCCSNSGRKKNV